MIFERTGLDGAYLVRPERQEDERGFFARTWCAREFGSLGLETRLVQSSVSFNRVKGTLRGMHYQISPSEEVKLVRCTKGSIYDAILDLRTASTTFGKHFGAELNEENRFLLYIPKGFAHGFLTLKGDTEVFYQMSEYYAPECARGLRWNDPAFRIPWPGSVCVISERDRNYPDFRNREEAR